MKEGGKSLYGCVFTRHHFFIVSNLSMQMFVFFSIINDQKPQLFFLDRFSAFTLKITKYNI